MEQALSLSELIARAAKGEPAAGETILAKLASGDPEDQLATLRALYRVTDVSFWEYMLQFLATGSWGGAAKAASSGAHVRQALQPKVRALFLAAPLDEPAGHARETALLNCVMSDNLEVSRVAADLAGISGSPRAVEPLISALKESHGRVQLQAVRALGRLGDARAVPSLIDALHSEDELLAALARDALVSIGSPAVEPLVRALDDVQSSEQVRWMAARALARIADARAIPTLIAHLSDPNYGVRWLSADGLVALKTEGLRAVLRALSTQHITPWLADAAAHVLQHAYPHEAKDIVKPVLEALRGVDATWSAPSAASHALDHLASKGLI